MNVKEKAQLAVITVKRKVLPVIASASVAMSTVAVNAFAVDETGGTSNMYQTIADTFKSGISDCVGGIVLIFGAAIPVGISIIGLYAAVGAGKKIFTKLVG